MYIYVYGGVYFAPVHVYFVKVIPRKWCRCFNVMHFGGRHKFDIYILIYVYMYMCIYIHRTDGGWPTGGGQRMHVRWKAGRPRMADGGRTADGRRTDDERRTRRGRTADGRRTDSGQTADGGLATRGRRRAQRY